MPLATDPLFFWTLLAIQFVGLVTMVLGRMPQSSALHSFCRTCFLACLIAVGLATIGTSMGSHTSCWAWCATIFSMMAVGATADLGGAAGAQGF
ncbi:MAG: hypothetical protein WD872_12925 [Pirellulaceae bacterium]